VQNLKHARHILLLDLVGLVPQLVRRDGKSMEGQISLLSVLDVVCLEDIKTLVKAQTYKIHSII
jgi:hypothetical protein